MKPIVFHREVEQELDEAMEWYEERREGLGLKFQEEIESTLERIQRNPEIVAHYPNSNHRFVIVPRFPYLVCYLETDSMIWISAIAHERREPGYWMHRSPEN